MRTARSWRGNVPLGGAAAVGLHYDCFGVGGALIRRDAFERLGGFELDGPPAVRRRDLLCRATLAGMRFEVVPEALLDYDRETADRQALRPDGEPRCARCGPTSARCPRRSSDLPGLAVSLSLVGPPAADPGERDAYVRGLEELVHDMVSSRSWRATALLRSAMKRFRGLELTALQRVWRCSPQPQQRHDVPEHGEHDGRPPTAATAVMVSPKR